MLFFKSVLQYNIDYCVLLYNAGTSQYKSKDKNSDR